MTTTQTPSDLVLTKVAAKSSKAEASYQGHPNGSEKCGNCNMYIPLHSSCTAVEGQVSHNGWCRYFEPTTGRSSAPWRNKLGE
jgi:hypothetical protein